MPSLPWSLQYTKKAVLAYLKSEYWACDELHTSSATKCIALVLHGAVVRIATNDSLWFVAGHAQSVLQRLIEMNKVECAQRALYSISLTLMKKT